MSHSACEKLRARPCRPADQRALHTSVPNPFGLLRPARQAIGADRAGRTKSRSMRWPARRSRSDPVRPTLASNLLHANRWADTSVPMGRTRRETPRASAKPMQNVPRCLAVFSTGCAFGRARFELANKQFFPQQQDSFQFQGGAQKAPTPVGRYGYCRCTAKSLKSFPGKPTIRSVKSPHVLAAGPDCYLFVHRMTPLDRFSSCFLISTRYFPTDEA